MLLYLTIHDIINIMSIDKYVPDPGNNKENLDFYEERGLTTEGVREGRDIVALFSNTFGLPTDEFGRSPDCDYPGELGPDGEPLGDL